MLLQDYILRYVWTQGDVMFVYNISLILTMYQQHYHQSRLGQSSYHEDIPFFREAVTLIDQCTKLMKDDRITLRNKLKDYFKQLKENKSSDNEWQSEQMQLLIHIFVEANKKKSLSKVQKGDKVMDWLQIKLRKYVDNNKKQRHKKQVEQYRVNKNGQFKKLKQNYHFAHHQTKQTTKQKPLRPNLTSNINKLSFNLGSKRSFGVNNSLSKSRDRDHSISARKTSQSNSYNSSSFHQKFNYLKKQKAYDASPQQKPSQRHKHSVPSHIQSMHLTNSNNQKLKSSSLQKRSGNVMSNHSKYSYKSYMPSQAEHKYEDISKLAELFTKQLNNNVYENEEDIIRDQKAFEVPQNYNYPASQKTIKPFEHLFTIKQNPSSKHGAINEATRYQNPSKNIEDLFKNTKNIMQSYQYKDAGTFDSFVGTKNKLNAGKYNQHQQFPSKVEENYESNSLFTPPDLLAQCRRFLTNSNQKRQLEAQQSSSKHIYNDLLKEQHKVMSFANTISQLKDRNQVKQAYRLRELNINEVTSQNNSLNISCKKPTIENNSQVVFKMKMINIHGIQQLLTEIFKSSHKVSLDRFQLGEIMSRCQPQTQKYLQSYCDILTNQSNTTKLNIDFLAFIKYLYTYGKVFQSNQQYFSASLCQILDIQKKGHVDNYDIEGFLQSIQNSQLQPYSYGEIKSLLTGIYEASCGVEGSQTRMTYWSLYFLQLRKDRQLQRLAEILNKFQFQYDTQQ